MSPRWLIRLSLSAPLLIGGATAAVLAAGISTATASSTRAGDQAWESWYRDIDIACPSHHVEWLYEATYPYLYEGFNSTLAPSERRRVQRIADTKQHCADETVGHSCELGRHLKAYRTVGLTQKFVRYTCRHVMCQDGALCSRAPGQP